MRYDSSLQSSCVCLASLEQTLVLFASLISSHFQQPRWQLYNVAIKGETKGIRDKGLLDSPET